MFEMLVKFSIFCETEDKHNPSNYSVIINTDKINTSFSVEKEKSFLSCSIYGLSINLTTYIHEQRKPTFDLSVLKMVVCSPC